MLWAASVMGRKRRVAQGSGWPLRGWRRRGLGFSDLSQIIFQNKYIKNQIMLQCNKVKANGL